MSFYLNRACRYPNVQRTERLTEKTVFKDEWTEKYVFILPQSSTESLFLICTETVGVIKRVAMSIVTMTQSTDISNSYILRIQR